MQVEAAYDVMLMQSMRKRLQGEVSLVDLLVIVLEADLLLGRQPTPRCVCRWQILV